MSFDVNSYEEVTASPAPAKPRVEPKVVDKLRATLGTTPQQAVRYDVTGKTASDISKAQGRLNSIGRRPGVEFSVKTQRIDNGGRTFVEAYAVAKRPAKPRGKR